LDLFELGLEFLHLLLRLNLLPREGDKERLNEERGQNNRNTKIMPRYDIIEKYQDIVDRLVNETMKQLSHNGCG
jgi:hypothetical protein